MLRKENARLGAGEVGMAWEARWPSCRVVFGDPVARGERRTDVVRRVQAEPHEVGVFFGVVVVATDDADGAERLRPEEDLCVEIPLADFQQDLVASLLGEFVDQPQDHLRADALTTEFGIDGEILNVEPRFVQLVDHEADDLVVEFGHHPDAVPLTETAEEVLFGPGEIKARLFDPEDIGHVPPE